MIKFRGWFCRKKVGNVERGLWVYVISRLILRQRMRIASIYDGRSPYL